MLYINFCLWRYPWPPKGCPTKNTVISFFPRSLYTCLPFICAYTLLLIHALVTWKLTCCFFGTQKLLNVVALNNSDPNSNLSLPHNACNSVSVIISSNSVTPHACRGLYLLSLQADPLRVKWGLIGLATLAMPWGSGLECTWPHTGLVAS